MEVQTRLGTRRIDPDKVIDFPRGLMGFEAYRRFTLLQLNPGSPFLVLQALDEPSLGLLVADPYTFLPEYRVRVGNAEQALLGVRSIHQVAVLVTVSIPHGKPEKTAVNLTGPILINHERRLGMQIPQSDPEFPSQVYIYKAPSETETPPPGADRAEPDV